jgi:hypothetical protein
MPLAQVASELGVSERYLVAGLRTALGVDPDLLARPADVRCDAACPDARDAEFKRGSSLGVLA